MGRRIVNFHKKKDPVAEIVEQINVMIKNDQSLMSAFVADTPVNTFHRGSINALQSLLKFIEGMENHAKP